MFALLARSYDTQSFSEWVLFVSGGSFVEMLRFGITKNGLVRYLSGANEDSSKRLIGSSVLINGAVTLCIVLILVTVNQLFDEAINDSGYQLFFTWYPWLVFLNLPWNIALVVLQAKMQYDRMLLIKLINSGLFFLAVVINTFLLELSIDQLVLILLVINLVTSLVCILKGWAGIRYCTRSSKATRKELLNFGKYSVFTIIGSNLLKNSDILIISISMIKYIQEILAMIF